MTNTVQAALAFRFTATCTDHRLQSHVDRMLAPLTVTDQSDDRNADVVGFTIDTCGRGPFELRLDGEVLADSESPAGPLAHLLHQVNLRAIESSDHLTLLHSAAACAPSGAVLFPAGMDSGKSTLAMALALRGWPYVTDEVVALKVDGQVVPYPRAISLDPGSWTIFPHLRPVVDPALVPQLPDQWQVPVASAGGRVATSAGSAVAVVLPSYTPAEPTCLEPISALEGLRLLLGATFRLERRPRRDLHVLADLVNRAPCYRLRVGELQEACEQLEAAFGTFQAPTRHSWRSTARSPCSIV